MPGCFFSYERRIDMKVRVHNIKAPLETEWEELREMVRKRICCPRSACTDFRIVKQSVDARKKHVCFVYSVDLEITGEVAADGKNVIVLKDEEESAPVPGTISLADPPVIVGSGPCGLFCALTLARMGYRPLLLERGCDVDSRTKAVQNYWEKGELNPESNIQFGEGGAGTFSDGKLTTRISDPKIMNILKDLVYFGAPEEILYRAKPHIGTDILKQVVKAVRTEIIHLGGDVRFETLVSDLEIRNGQIAGVTLSSGEQIPCQILVLALGHSARDTYEMLCRKGIAMEQKAFSVGARIEHLQSFIDKSMYGDFAGHPKLGAADYQLSYRNGNDACYSFCMCPGGVVVAAASEPDTVVTNGMSYYARNGKNANAAICVNVSRQDFASDHPLAGVYYQRELEHRAFLLGGENGNAPAQKVCDYLNGKATSYWQKVYPSYPLGVAMTDLSRCFSARVSHVLTDGLRMFDKKIKGFTANGAILTGVETRTSAPLRILRGESLESISVKGLYPAGEGAGYAGGIMSAAADGIRVANQIISVCHPKNGGCMV